MQASVARVAERVDRALHLHPVGREGRYKSTCKSEFKVSWREASPPNHHADKVVSDQWVVSKEFSLWGQAAVARIAERVDRALHRWWF